MIGLGVKRWLVILTVAAAMLGVGLVFVVMWLRAEGWISAEFFKTLSLIGIRNQSRIVMTLIPGAILFLVAIIKLTRNLIEPFRQPNEDIAESLVRFRQRGRGPRIVAIGGGTGMPSLLRGLKAHTSNITAIVTVADDGGSSGRLRREYGLLPPGDFRNNIAALAKDEGLMTQVIQYRFGTGISADQPSQLGGHAFGNLLIAALTGITGSFDEALLNMDKVLAMRGRVVPSTIGEVTLVADVEKDGQIQRIVGESAIPKTGGRIQRVMLEGKRLRGYPPALRAILQADMVVMGPGSLFTSVLPNLLVPDIANALLYTRAKRVYVCNVATQMGETDAFTVSDHVRAIQQHVGRDCLDYVIANSAESIPSPDVMGRTVFVQPDSIEHAQLILDNLTDTERPWRHDSKKVAEIIIELLQ